MHEFSGHCLMREYNSRILFSQYTQGTLTTLPLALVCHAGSPGVGHAADASFLEKVRDPYAVGRVALFDEAGPEVLNDKAENRQRRITGDEVADTTAVASGLRIWDAARPTHEQLMFSDHFTVDHGLIGHRRESVRDDRIATIEIVVVSRSELHTGARFDCQSPVRSNSSYLWLGPSGKSIGPVQQHRFDEACL